VLAHQQVGQRLVPVDVQSVVGDQDGVERSGTRCAVVAAQNPQQNAILVSEDLLEPVKLETGGGEAIWL